MHLSPQEILYEFVVINILCSLYSFYTVNPLSTFVRVDGVSVHTTDYGQVLFLHRPRQNNSVIILSYGSKFNANPAALPAQKECAASADLEQHRERVSDQHMKRSEMQ